MRQVPLKLIEHGRRRKMVGNEAACLIGSDVGLTARVMSAARNTAAEQGKARPLTLEHSLRTIGLEAVKLIVVNESVRPALRFDDGLNANHGTPVRLSHVEEAYRAGLLHAVMRLASSTNRPQQASSHAVLTRIFSRTGNSIPLSCTTSCITAAGQPVAACACSDPDCLGCVSPVYM